MAADRSTTHNGPESFWAHCAKHDVSNKERAFLRLLVRCKAGESGGWSEAFWVAAHKAAAEWARRSSGDDQQGPQPAAEG